LKQERETRKWSAGTKVMLVMLVLVLAGSALVLGRLSSGAQVDLSRLSMKPLALDGGETGTEEERTKTDEPAPSPLNTATPAPAAAAAAQTTSESVEFTLTAGGVLCLDGEVRKNSRSTDAKIYDYTDMMVLLKDEIRSDVNLLFLENILMDSAKASDTTAPESAADLLREGGFTLAACGFSQAYAHGADGIGATRMALMERGMTPAGIRDAEDMEKPEILTINGMKTAFLQYTGTVSTKTRKNMEKNGVSRMVPAAEEGLIREEISAARDAGAEAVIVMINWGRTGKTQRALAEAAAQAGADLIIGGGSRAPEGAEYLTGKDGGRILCIWNAGSLLTGSRGNAKQTAGYLLHVTIRRNSRGGVDVLAPEYTPVYTWKYKQDGRFYYRCLTAEGPAPDGMDREQQRNREKALAAVEDALKGSPLTLRVTGP